MKEKPLGRFSDISTLMDLEQSNLMNSRSLLRLLDAFSRIMKLQLSSISMMLIRMESLIMKNSQASLQEREVEITLMFDDIE